MIAAYDRSDMHALARMLGVSVCLFFCSYTFKPLGAGFYGLRKATHFRETIMKLIMEGGDADT